MPERNQTPFNESTVEIVNKYHSSFYNSTGNERYMGSREFSSKLKFHPYGDVTCVLDAVHSDLSGFNVETLTPDGEFDTKILSYEFKTIAGQHSADIANFIRASSDRAFADSQVSLLYNMLRYVCMHKWFVNAEIHQKDLSTEMSYNDGHVEARMETGAVTNAGRLSMNRMSTMNELGVQIQVIHGSVHPNEAASDAIDCTGLTAAQITMLIAMLGPWTEQSRIRLGHPSPALVENGTVLAVRTTLNAVEDRLLVRPAAGDADAIAAEAALFEPDQMWKTLRMYVHRNRLYEQLAEAARMVVAVAFDVKPESLEALRYQDFKGVMHLPSFRASRGFFTKILIGKAAMVSQTAITESRWVMTHYSTIQIPAMVVAHSKAIGLAVQDMHTKLWGKEVDIHDVQIRALIPKESVAAYMALAHGNAAYTFRGNYGYIPSAIGDACPWFVRNIDAAAEVERNYQVRRVQPAHVIDGNNYNYELKSTCRAIPQTPLLDLPYTIEPSLVPFMQDDLTVSRSERPRSRRLTSSWEEYHKIATIARIAGYSVSVTMRGKNTTAFADNDTSAIQIVPVDEVMDNPSVRPAEINDWIQRANHFVPLPDLLSPADWVVRMLRSKLRSHYGSPHQNIFISSSYTSPGNVSTEFVMYEGLARRIPNIYLRRHGQDFRLVEDVQAGAIPPALPGAHIPDVAHVPEGPGEAAGLAREE